MVRLQCAAVTFVGCMEPARRPATVTDDWKKDCGKPGCPSDNRGQVLARGEGVIAACSGRPPIAKVKVNNVKTTDGASVSKDIHTDSQLYPAQFGKAAYTG